MPSHSIFNDPVVYAQACALASEGAAYRLVASVVGSSNDAAKDFLNRWRLYGDDGAMTSGSKKKFTQQEKIDAVEMFLAGTPRREVMATFGISALSTFKAWVRIYREHGFEGLAPKRRGRKSNTTPQVLTEQQHLAAENAQLKAEVAYLKALAAVEEND